MATIDLSDRPYCECPECGRGVTGTIALPCKRCGVMMEQHRPNIEPVDERRR